MMRCIVVYRPEYRYAIFAMFYNVMCFDIVDRYRIRELQVCFQAVAFLLSRACFYAIFLLGNMDDFHMSLVEICW